MQISQETIQTVQSSIQIEEVIGNFVTLKRKGTTLWACCPFHHEKTPSFAVSPTKGFYKCFGCDAAGDAITFIREIEGVSFVEAITFLAQKYGIAIQEDKNQSSNKEVQKAKDSLYILLNVAKVYYTNALWENREGKRIAHSYLQARGIPIPCSKKFDLGYSLDTWDAFHQFAQQKGYSDELLIQAGLLIKKETHKVYDRFRGRLMFPIHNVSGQVIAFGARVLAQGKDSPKYINSPETAIYHKGNALYGLYQAKQKIREKDCCYLVEGYTDVLALHIAGIEHVVASSGTALTENQIQLISRFTKKITILFDGDVAGIKAALKGIDLVLEKGLHVKVVGLPDGEDPDSYGRKLGATTFQKYLQNHAQDFITFKVNLLMAADDWKDPIYQANAIQDILQSIIVIPDEVAQALFIKKCSELLGITEHILLAAKNKLLDQKNNLRHQEIAHKRKQRRGQAVTATWGRKGIVKIDQLADSLTGYEREVIRILFSYGMQKFPNGTLLYDYILTELKDVTFRSEQYRFMIDYFQAQLKQGKVVDMTYCIQGEDEKIKKIAIDIIAAPHEISEAWQKKYSIYTNLEENNLHQTAFQTILRLKLRLIQQLIVENREGLQEATTMEKEEELLHIHTALKETEAAIATKLGTVVTNLNS